MERRWPNPLQWTTPCKIWSQCSRVSMFRGLIHFSCCGMMKWYLLLHTKWWLHPSIKHNEKLRRTWIQSTLSHSQIRKIKENFTKLVVDSIGKNFYPIEWIQFPLTSKKKKRKKESRCEHCWIEVKNEMEEKASPTHLQRLQKGCEDCLMLSSRV